MRPEESFTAYVGARWSMFFRFATVLVGERAADGLTQTALVRAFRSWDEIQAAGYPDELVKKMLVKGALRSDRRGAGAPLEPDRRWESSSSTHDGTAADLGALWSRIAGLPSRQRAILVLRHYEGLSDASIAEVLGRAIRTVTAEEATALETLRAAAREDPDADPAEVMPAAPTPADLVAVFAARAQAAALPPAPVEDLLARAARERRDRSRRGIVATAAAVVALAATGLLLLSPSDGTGGRAAHGPRRHDRPLTLESLPGGATTTIGFTAGAKLYLGRVVIDLPGAPDQLVQAPGVVLVYYGDGRILRSGTDPIGLQMLTRHAAGPPVVDSTGTYVAWQKRAPGAVVVRARLDGRPGLSATRFPVTPTCCDNPFDLDGVTTSGKVVASMQSLDRGWVWTPGSGAPVPFALGGGRIDQVAGERMLRTGSDVRVFDLSGAAPRPLERARAGDTEQVAALSPDGGQLALTDRSGFIALSVVADHGQPALGSQIAIPRNAVVETIRWQGEHRLLVQALEARAPRPLEWLLGCDTGTGGCTTIVVDNAQMLLAQ